MFSNYISRIRVFFSRYSVLYIKYLNLNWHLIKGKGGGLKTNKIPVGYIAHLRSLDVPYFDQNSQLYTYCSRFYHIFTIYKTYIYTILRNIYNKIGNEKKITSLIPGYVHFFYPKKWFKWELISLRHLPVYTLIGKSKKNLWPTLDPNGLWYDLSPHFLRCFSLYIFLYTFVHV